MQVYMQIVGCVMYIFHCHSRRKHRCGIKIGAVQFSCLFVCLFVSSCLDVWMSFFCLFVCLFICLLSVDAFGHTLEEIDRYPALTNHAPANSMRPQ